MKKTLLSILALSASVAFAQNFQTMNIASNSLSANKAGDTLLFMQGPDCTNEVLLPGIFASTSANDSTLEAVQKFTFTTGGTISAGGVMVGFKKQGAVGGTTTYKLKIYDDNNGAIGNLLGESNTVTFADLEGPTGNNVTITPMAFATPVTVGTTFYAGFIVNDAVAGTDTVDLIEAYPFSGTGTQVTSFAELAGDCAGSTAFVGNEDGFIAISALSQAAPAIAQKLDPKLGIAVLLTPTVSIENNSAVSYSIFPNPTSDVLNVQYTLAKEGNVTMNITDLTGRTIKSIVKENQGTFQVTEQINIAGLNSGIYMLTVNANGNTTTQKFIVK